MAGAGSGNTGGRRTHATPPEAPRSLYVVEGRTVDAPRVARALSSRTAPFPANDKTEAQHTMLRFEGNGTPMPRTAHPVEACRLRVETIDHDHAVWILLRGEADIATLVHLEASLARIPIEGSKSVHLHVADLDFCDVSTLLQLTDFARTVTKAGQHVTTCGARPIIHKVARLLDVHGDLGMT